MASLCFAVSCHKDQLSKKGAQVAVLPASDSNPMQKPADDRGDASDELAQPGFTRTLLPRKPRRTTPRQPELSAYRRVTNTASDFSRGLSASVEPVTVPTSDPEELIKQASDVMNHGGIPISVTAASIGGTFPNSFHFSYLRAVALQQAALTSGRAIELLKQQPVPTDPAEKDKYTALLLKGLSIRAEALGRLAAVDRSQGIKAQIAYQDYLAAESDELKKENAERNYAAMLDKLEEVEKARVAYEALLARNPTDADALEALVSIHRKRAVAQKRAGKIRAARMSNQLARSYSDRLTEVRVTDGSVTTSDSVSDGTKADRDTVFKRGEAVKRFMEPVKVNPETRRESTVPMRAKKP
jgi:cell fate (sporulation/competence/biofilm development) regulator YmcA (YheA/YmcA/DUF963 family)